jgi:hypothetical protein
MTTTARTPVSKNTQRVPMSPLRKSALLVGILFVITYITAILAKFVLYPPLLEDPAYLLSDGPDTMASWGALAELILIIANIGTAVALYPVLRRRYPGLALGFVTARVMESVFIAVGVLSILSIVTMRQDFASNGATDPATITTVGHAFVTLQEWTFILGPGFVVGVGNGILLGYMLYRSNLVPRGMAILGLVGGPLVCISGAAVVLGLIEGGSVVQTMACMPEFFWELSLGIYLIVKGFKPAAVTAGTVHEH